MLDFLDPSEWISSAIDTILHNTIYKLFYYITVGILFILRVLDNLFRVLIGIDKVKYNGVSTYLADVFFEHDFVRSIYAGMALIGIGMAFFFAVLGVIRKAADVDDKDRRTLSSIVSNLIKTIFVILSLTMFMQALVYGSNVLLERISFIFDNASSLGKSSVVHFTNEEYAAMGRILNTVGNYSLNPSSRSRYNIDACYNDISSDLKFLWDSGKFQYYYEEKKNGRIQNTWQSIIQTIMNANYPGTPLSADVYNEGVSKAILGAMDIVKNDTSIYALQDYKTKYVQNSSSIPLDRMLFLMGTLNAAKNDGYNQNPSVDDALRAPYYRGEKDYYDYDDVGQDFDISIFKMDYIVIWASAIVAIPSLAGLLFSCVARIFNMLLLYLAAPPLLASSSLDGGAKQKQWLTAFIIQTFAVFGTVIAMRMVFIFVPIIASSKLYIFENSFLNLLSKLVIILLFYKVADKSNSIITSVLAENAGITGTSNIEQTGRIASEMWKEHTQNRGSKGGGGGGGKQDKSDSSSNVSAGENLHKENNYSNNPSRNTQYDGISDDGEQAQFNGGSVTDDMKKEGVKMLAESQGIPGPMVDAAMEQNEGGGGGGNAPFDNVMNVVNNGNNNQNDQNIQNHQNDNNNNNNNNT